MAILESTLILSVPFWIEKIKMLSSEERYNRAKICGEILKTMGEAAIYKTDVPGSSKDAFNSLAEAIAIMSFVPGGIEVFGTRWITDGSKKVENRNSNDLGFRQ